MIRTILISALAFAWAGAARAEVLSASADGFEVRQQVVVPASAAGAYAQFVKVGAWWSSDHTFSGDAGNLKITPRAGECWCERLANGGSVKHMEVVAVAPGESLVFVGGLGPLQSMGASGAMTVTFNSEGAGAKVTLTYVVNGFSGKAFDKIAPAVDGVLNEQMKRYGALWTRPLTLLPLRAIDAVLAKHAQILINPPVLQPAGLYLELAGEDLRKRAFVIDDMQGEELCLRPDMTVPACRAALALPNDGPFAVRYQGLVFRRQSALMAGAAEFVQAGAEWFAPADDMQTREPVILAAALEACRTVGVEPELRIGNVGLFAALVDSAGLDPVWSARLIRAFARAGGPAGVMAEALAPAPPPSALAEALATMPAGRAGAALGEMLEMAGVAPVGGRSVDDIAARLREQGARAGAARPTEAQFEPIRKALAIEDAPDAAMRAMAALAKPGSRFGQAVERFRAFWEQAGKLAKAPANTRFAFSLGRGISYYDGLVFELEASKLGPRASLGGGGRYDGLLQALAANEKNTRFETWAAAGFALRPKRLEDAAK